MSAGSPSASSASGRRVLALVLPELLCELAEQRLLWGFQRSKAKPPLGVVLVSSAQPKQAEASAERAIDATAKLSAVNESARRYGVREGQSIAEACALVASLVIREVAQTEVLETLGCIAEVGLSLGATVTVEAPDTVCVDITGSAHLQGGELALACELANRVRGMGHSVRVAISDGPRLARAFAHWFTPEAADPEDRGVCVVPSGRTVEAFSALPVTALPIAQETAAWFVRLGVFTVGELCALPKAALGSRLGEAAASVSELCAGRDRVPLVAYTPERTVSESSSWDEPVTGSEPLLFVLGGLVSRVSARLTGRGEAAHSLVLTILYDPSIARFRGEKTERVLSLGHDRLSTYGLLSGHAQTELRDWIYQLIGHGVLAQEGDKYPILRLTETSRAVLRGEENVRLVQIARKEKRKKSKVENESWEGVDADLFESLRKFRRDLASSRAVIDLTRRGCRGCYGLVPPATIHGKSWPAGPEGHG